MKKAVVSGAPWISLMDAPDPPPHKSRSTVQGEVEVAMLGILGSTLGKPLQKTSVDYHGAKMEVDGVDVDETVFVEAFARLGILKSGQRRKVATDILKFVALQADRPRGEVHPRLRRQAG